MAVRREDTPAAQMAPKPPAPPVPTPDPMPAPATQDGAVGRVAELERENADLRRQVAAARKAETAKAGPAKPFRVRVSEGTRADLVLYGEVIEPATGLLLKRDKDTGEVTVFNRGTGEVADVEVIV